MSTVAEIMAIIEKQPERAFLEILKFPMDDASRVRLMEEAVESGCKDWASVFEHMWDRLLA